MSASLLTRQIGFRKSEDIIASIAFVYAVSFLLVNGTFSAIECFKNRNSSDDDFFTADKLEGCSSFAVISEIEISPRVTTANRSYL